MPSSPQGSQMGQHPDEDVFDCCLQDGPEAPAPCPPPAPSLTDRPEEDSCWHNWMQHGCWTAQGERGAGQHSSFTVESFNFLSFGPFRIFQYQKENHSMQASNSFPRLKLLWTSSSGWLQGISFSILKMGKGWAFTNTSS